MENLTLKYKFKVNSLLSKNLNLFGGANCAVCGKNILSEWKCQTHNISFCTRECAGIHFRQQHCTHNPKCLAQTGICYDKQRVQIGTNAAGQPVYFITRGEQVDEKCCDYPKAPECPESYNAP